MSRKPEVTLTFAGDHDQLTKSFDKVGAASKGMEADVGRASKAVRDSGDSFDRAGEASDNLDTKAMGFRDTLTGVEDTGRGVSMMMKGDMFDGALMLGMGLGDLGSGLYNFIIPSIKAFGAGMIRSAVGTARATASTVAHGIATKASTVATGALTIAQRGLNLAMRANPIGLVITALFAIGAAFVLAYKKSETFRKIVTGAVNGVKAVVRGVGDFISGVWRRAFGAVRTAWNSTVGGKGFSIPDWVPIIGGRSFRIPRMHSGGIVPGAPGQESLAILQAGEEVKSRGQAGGARVVVELRGQDDLARLLVEVLRKAIRGKGGDVQFVLGDA
jgi:phage-related protein